MMPWLRWFSFTQVPSFFLKSSGDVFIIACLVAWKLKPARSLQTYDVLFRAQKIEQTTGTFEKNRGGQRRFWSNQNEWSIDFHGFFFSVCPFKFVEICVLLNSKLWSFLNGHVFFSERVSLPTSLCHRDNVGWLNCSGPQLLRPPAMLDLESMRKCLKKMAIRPGFLPWGTYSTRKYIKSLHFYYMVLWPSEYSSWICLDFF